MEGNEFITMQLDNRRIGSSCQFTCQGGLKKKIHGIEGFRE